MKTLSRFAVPLILAASFSMPLLAAAQTCWNDGAPCGNGGVCRVDPQGTFYCAPAGTPGQTSSGAGSVNQTWAIYYKDLIVWFVNVILVPVLMAVAFIVFLWGIYKYFIYGASNESEKAEGRKFAMWGIIGFVVITSVWGIVNIVKSTVVPSSAGSTRPNYPTL